MKERFTPPSLVFYGLTALMVIISAVSLFSALSWLNRPMAGFLLYDFPQLGSYGSRDWPGSKAGLRYMDHVLEADGNPIREGRDLVNMLKDKLPGTHIRYLVKAKGITREISLPVTRFGLNNFLLIFLAPYIVGLVVFALGFIVYLLKPNIRSSWVFLIMCLILGTFVMTGFEIQSSYHFVELHYFFIPFVGATIFHLSLIFPDKKRILNRFPVLEYLIYLPALAIAVCYELYLFTFRSGSVPSWIPHPSTVTPNNRLFTLVCIAAVAVFLIHSLIRAMSPAARQRARMVLFGMTIAFLPPVVIMLAVSVAQINFPWNFLVFFVLFFPASIAYSIVRHNLFDADTIIKRTVGYFIVTAIVIGAYALVSISFNVFLGQYQLAQSRAFPIIFTLGVILVFNPLRDRIQNLVDRIFFRKEYDYGTLVEKVGGAMTSLLELPQILQQLIKTFNDDMFISTGSVMLMTPDGTRYQVYLADGEKKKEVANRSLGRDEPVINIIETDKRELTKYDVLEDPRYKDVSVSSAANFEALYASLIVPLVYQNKVIGALNLGEKKSGKPFNREDIELLRTLAHQGAVAIENARMVDEIIEKERLRSKIMDSFGKYVTSEVRDQILEGRIPLDGELKDVTVLFADLRGFTTLTESTNPKEVVKIINGYFSEMSEAIRQNHGLVLQFIGDEIEAVFGAPTSLEDHPTHAVRAAREMRKRLVSVNEKLREKGYPPLRHGIGIHSGNVVAANIGSEDRLSYALVGDTVNAASRIQSLNKEYNTDILLSSITLKRLTEYIHGEKLGATMVKGKKEPLEIFKLA